MAERFLVTQPCGKVRAIDNAKGTQRNFHTEMVETIHVVSADFVLVHFALSHQPCHVNARRISQSRCLSDLQQMTCRTHIVAALSLCTIYASTRRI